jgi:hypothetical protein
MEAGLFAHEVDLEGKRGRCGPIEGWRRR